MHSQKNLLVGRHSFHRLLFAHKTHPSVIKQEPEQMPDLIDDGTWREASLDRMSEVFPTNRVLWPMYLLMAGRTATPSTTSKKFR